MSGVIHFTSGKTLEITEREFQNIAPKLKNGGIRLVMTSRGDFIPLNSTTMEYIEHVIGKGEAVKHEVVKETPRQNGEEVDRGDSVPETPKAEEPKEEVKEEGLPKKSAMDILIEKSNCKHEPEKLTLYVQHTAKGVRYFPVCSFCGKRERYVSEKKILEGDYAGTVNEKWTAEDVENATPWTEN